ncbi:response regulator [bacterium]|nr:response regulator [bacterium]
MPENTPVLIVDDDENQRRLLSGCLAQHGYATLTAADGLDALDRLARDPVAMIISDMRMPRMTGLDLLRAARERGYDFPFLLVTAFPDVRDAVGAMRDGAVNYLEKPIDLDELLTSVRTALGRRISSEIARPDVAIPPGVIADSPPMRSILRDVALVGPTDSRVLLTGESGTGKEVIADALHRISPRARQPFLKVNCAAIPENLLESELFGHEKGAFSGAVARRVGVFEEADGGTILLDEIGDMPMALQAKLLRVIQDGVFRRIGGSQTLHTDIRLIASTNRDLEQDMIAGRFREDLFFRLNVFEIHLPPLRERPEDIIPLATHFASGFLGGKVRFSPAAVALLSAYRWPGNVRELRNAMERAVLVARSEVILPEHFPPRLQTRDHTAPVQPASSGMIADVERSLILQTLKANRYNRSESARELGISRRALLYKLQRLREMGFDVDGEAR